MKYDMVFEGGGAKGIAFVGAMQVFEAQGHTPGRLLGTSAGAISATLIAAGYTADEMLAVLAEKKNGLPVFADFLGVPTALDKAALQTSVIRELVRKINLPFIPDRFEEKVDDLIVASLAAQPSLRHLFSFAEYGGWYSADNFLAWLRGQLDSRVDKGKAQQFSPLTLTQYHEATDVELSLIAADTTKQKMLILNHRTAPDLPLVWAVRMSMSVPLLWQEVIWQKEWGAYRGAEMAGHTIVDGGLLSNFPLELFVSNDARVTGIMGEKSGNKVLGLLIDETLPVSGVSLPAKQVSKFDMAELRTVQRLANLINTMLGARDKMVIDDFDDLVVRLPAQGYDTTEFDMQDEKRELLVKAGREAMAAYFERVAASDMVSFDPTPTADDEKAQRAADKLALKLLAQ